MKKYKIINETDLSNEDIGSLIDIYIGRQSEETLYTGTDGKLVSLPNFEVEGKDLVRWVNSQGEEITLDEVYTENTTIYADKSSNSKREEMKELIKHLRSVYSNIDMNIYQSTQNVNLDTLISYVKDGKVHHFLDNY